MNHQPLVKHSILWIQDEKWIGPVDLIHQVSDDSWVVAPQRDLNSIKYWKIPLEAIQQVKIEGVGYLLVTDLKSHGQHIGLVNWESDEVLAKRVLSHLVKLDRNTVEALKISKSVFKAYVETIEHADMINRNDLAFHDRIKGILEIISKNEELLDEAAKICFTINSVEEKVNEKAAVEYQRKLAEHEKCLEEELANKRAEIGAIVNTLSEKKQELCTIEERLKSQDKELEERVSGFESELEEKLRILAEKPQRLFAEMAVFKALIPTVSRAHTNQPIVTDIDSNFPIVNESAMLTNNLSNRLIHSGISPVVGHALHSTLLAGLTPVLTGTEAYQVVSNYAECVSAGRLLWIPVGGSVLEPSDLLARFDPATRCLIPHPAGLLDLLLDESDNIHIIVLEGFNRAAVDGYLMSLLESAQDVALGRNPRSIPLAPRGFVSENSTYAGVSSVTWRNNVLLVLCPSTGVSSLPLPAEFWTHCAVLDTSEPAPAGVTPELGAIPAMTRVPATVWKAWFKGIKEKSGPLEVIRSLSNSSDALPTIVISNIERLFSAGISLGRKHEGAFEQAIRMTLLPYLVAIEKDVDTWFKHLNIELRDEDRKIENIIKRLGE